MMNELKIPIRGYEDLNILEDTEVHKRIIVIRVMIQISDKDNCIYIGHSIKNMRDEASEEK